MPAPTFEESDLIFSPKKSTFESPRHTQSKLGRSSITPRRHRTPIRKELTAENYSIRKHMADSQFISKVADSRTITTKIRQLS